MPRITMSMPESFRADMNSKTPRSGDWTYHHVLPVRSYYVAAHMLAFSYKKRRQDPDIVTALAGMCNDKQNRRKIPDLLGKVDVDKNDTIRDLAKLCASPLFGGFAGPFPGQRCDDPKDQAERVKPPSGDPAWWGGLQLLGEHVDCFLSRGSGGGTTLAVDLDDDLLDHLTDRITAIVKVLGEMFGEQILPFDPGDWQYCPSGAASGGRSWVLGKGLCKTAVAGGDSALPRLKVRTDDGGRGTPESGTASDAPKLQRLGSAKDKLVLVV